MVGLISFVHIAVCILLVIIVLLQHGKGADAGAALSGGQSAVFGARGAASFLSKVTTACAVVFMLTSLSLVYISSQQANETVFDGTESATAVEETVKEGTEAAAAGEAVEGAVDKAVEAGKEIADDAKEAVTEAAKTVTETVEKAEDKK